MAGIYILIAVGAVMMFVGFLGCYGAIQESQCLLGTVRSWAGRGVGASQGAEPAWFGASLALRTSRECQLSGCPSLFSDPTVADGRHV